MEISIGIAFLGGLLSFLSPCVLPLVPAYIGYLGGQVTQTVAAQLAGGAIVQTQITLGQRLSTLIQGMAFVAGFTFVFVALGLATTAFLQVIGGTNIRLFTTILGHVGGVFLVLLGLHVMGVLPTLFARFLAAPRLSNSPLSSLIFAVIVTVVIFWAFVEPLFALPVLASLGLWLLLGGAFTSPASFWTNTINGITAALYADTRKQFDTPRQPALASSFFMGLVFAAGWTPCIGPIYGAILTMAARDGDVAAAGSQLIAYSLGLGVPFLLAALMMDGTRSVLRRLSRHMRWIKRASGALLIIIGIAIATGRMQEFSRGFANEFTDFSIQLETCTLAIVQEGQSLDTFLPCMNTSEGS
jgi:cytochrome c-type biogenesis protein